MNTHATVADDQTGDIIVRCTKGTSGITIDLGNGAHNTGQQRRMVNLANQAFINYEVYQETGRISVWGAGDGGSVRSGADLNGTGRRGCDHVRTHPACPACGDRGRLQRHPGLDHQLLARNFQSGNFGVFSPAMGKATLSALLLLGSILGLGSRADASSFTVNPITVTLSGKDKSALLTLQSQTSEEIRFKVLVQDGSRVRKARCSSRTPRISSSTQAF